MDYSELLRKYIEHVGRCEGANFISQLNHVQNYSDDKPMPFFAPDEQRELRRLSKTER